MEGVFAFFAESSFLGVFLFGEGRIAPVFHWFASVMVAAGAVLSGFFIVATNAWMQHPLGYAAVGDRVELTSLRALLGNPYARWQYLHVVSGALITGSMVMAGIGAFYLLAHRHEEPGRLFVRVGVSAGIIFSLFSLFPTGWFQGENITRFQPAKMAAMEGVFRTQEGAPLAIIGMPDTERRELMDPIYVPGMLSYLAYGNAHAKVTGLDDIPQDRQPPIEIVYYAYRAGVGRRGSVSDAAAGFQRQRVPRDSTSTTPRRPLTACVSRAGSIWLGSRSSHISPMCTARGGASRDRRTSRKRRRASPLPSIETLRQRARKRGAFSRGGLGRQLLDRPRQLPRPVPVADEGRRVDALAPPEHVVDREDQQI